MKTISLIGILFFFICSINCNEIPSDTFLFENFQNGFGKWQISKDAKYQGTWSIGEPEEDSFVGIKGDSYLVANDAAKHHSIYRKFDKVLDNSANKDLVIQYEVKYQKGLTCGGSYIKLLKSPLEKFGGDSPYIIMFGPDKCGTTNKVHFIFRHYNPVTKVWEEKHLKNAPEIRDNKLTHLYTLRISSDNTFAIYIDKEIATEGNLLESFEPPVNPPKTIDDPTDIKPENWVDEETIDDPNAKIPEGWDETQPEFINNPDVSKPVDWDESEEENIPDPKAKKPDDWDDELDGVWVAPSVPNPKCETTGCGKWVAPVIKNPKYMGKYVFPKIKNPAFKGVWKAKQINNPGFYEDLTPYKFDKIDGLGIEIWTMDEKYSFDNFLIGYNLQSALDYAERTWKVKYDNEMKQEEEASASNQQGDTLAEIIQFLKENSTVFVVVGLAFIGVLVFLIIFICRSGGDDKKDKDSSDEEEDDSEEEGEEKAKFDEKNPNLRKRIVNKDKDDEKK